MSNAPPRSLLVDSLSKARCYPHEVSAVRLIETHISWVLLTGTYAYKIKKPVNFGFLDFSTLAQRRFCCAEELRLNQRLAKDLYLEVVAITGTAEQPILGGTGEAIEYAVKMREFPAGLTLSERAECGQLTSEEIDQISDILTHFHQQIARTEEKSEFGDSECIQHWFTENFDAIEPLLTDAQQKQQLLSLQQWGNQQNLAAIMQQRKNKGFVRECHGDLHLSNMTLINGQVTFFDCIEFNPRLRWIDVISDLAFLLIDLVHYDYENYAHRLLNRYLQATGDYAGLALLRYYLVYRALVCAKVVMLRHAQLATKADCVNYTEFANLAERTTQIAQPQLIITHGYSGSGKSTYAQRLAETLGAVQIRSDIERKRLFGYAAHAMTDSAVAGDIYSESASRQTYAHLLALTETVLTAGYTAIVDATFLNVWQRDLFAQLAKDLGIRFVIIDFQASIEVLCQRIAQRQNDASEATIAVLHQQLQSAEPLLPTEQPYLLVVNTESDAVLSSG